MFFVMPNPGMGLSGSLVFHGKLTSHIIQADIPVVKAG
jgi:hypothetical protein